MSDKVEVIPASEALRNRIGPRLGRIDAGAIAKAEAALKGLSSQFGQWLQDEVGKLEAARAAAHAEGMDAEHADELYTRAHDLKGLGATYEYPLVSQIGSSLCRVLGGPESRSRTPLPLIDAHVDAIAEAVRGKTKEADTPEGRALVEALERRVAEFVRAS
jgi:hypothetical protein